MTRPAVATVFEKSAMRTSTTEAKMARDALRNSANRTKPERDFFKIDEHDLVREWVEQPELFYKYARRLADARLELSQRETAVDVAKADADNLIRERPKKFGLPEKPTEAAIKAAIINMPSYTQAMKFLHEAAHAVALLDAAVKTLDHRKRALENLVDLHGQNYFASPRDKSGKAGDMVSRRANRPLRDDEE